MSEIAGINIFYVFVATTVVIVALTEFIDTQSTARKWKRFQERRSRRRCGAPRVSYDDWHDVQWHRDYHQALRDLTGCDAAPAEKKRSGASLQPNHARRGKPHEAIQTSSTPTNVAELPSAPKKLRTLVSISASINSGAASAKVSEISEILSTKKTDLREIQV